MLPNINSLEKGIYRFELWGAQGGDARALHKEYLRKDSGGKGAYVAGDVYLTSYTRLYLYIGGKGEDQSSTSAGVVSNGGFNGGGQGGIEIGDSLPESSAGGGGATDIRILKGDSVEHHKSRIIVAAGGGGACSTDGLDGYSCDYRGGHGGNITGVSYNNVSKGGLQSSGSFFQGKEGLTRTNNDLIAGGSTGGGGGGYYGGDCLKHSDVMNIYALEVGGAGGSSYVSGCEECDTTNVQEIIFHNIVMYSGEQKFNKLLSMEYENGHSGNSSFVITFLCPIQHTCKGFHLFCFRITLYMVIIFKNK